VVEGSKEYLKLERQGVALLNELQDNEAEMTHAAQQMMLLFGAITRMNTERMRRRVYGLHSLRVAGEPIPDLPTFMDQVKVVEFRVDARPELGVRDDFPLLLRLKLPRWVWRALRLDHDPAAIRSFR
jgi:hypothetical protein